MTMASRRRGPAPLVGRWKTEGWTWRLPAGPWQGSTQRTRTRGWPAVWVLLHTVDAYAGDQKVEGAEIIGYDLERAGYLTLYFGSDGLTTYEATLWEEAGTLVWEMRSETTRFSGTFSPDATPSQVTGSYSTRVRNGVAVDGYHVDETGWLSDLSRCTLGTRPLPRLVVERRDVGVG